MKYTITLSILLFSLITTSCKETKKTIEEPSNEIVSGKYEIKSLNGRMLVHTLFFNLETSEDKISGKTDCNSYFGTFKPTIDNQIKIGPLASTEMYCEENVMKIEFELFKAYGDSKTYNFDNKMLTLFDESGMVIIRAYKVSK